MRKIHCEAMLVLDVEQAGDDVRADILVIDGPKAVEAEGFFVAVSH